MMPIRSALLAVAASLAWVMPAAAPATACTAPHSRGDAGVVETVVAVFDHVRAADRAALLAAAQEDGYWSLRHEPGTISYHVVPDPADPARFVFVGTFADAAAYAVHRTSPAARAFFALAARDHVTGPELVVAGESVPNTDGRHRARSRGDAGVVETVVAVFDHVRAADRAAVLASGQEDGYWSLRHESGTISYHVVPDPADPARFVFVGTFADAAAYAVHRTSPAARAFFALAARDHVTGPELVVAGTSVPNVPAAGPSQG